MATGTPATALLSTQGVAHTLHTYTHDPRALAFGEEAAASLGVDEQRLLKTLIASLDGTLACAVVPVAGRLDLKAFAAALGGKRAELADPRAAERPDPEVGTVRLREASDVNGSLRQPPA